jgi:hypothetical protein
VFAQKLLQVIHHHVGIHSPLQGHIRPRVFNEVLCHAIVWSPHRVQQYATVLHDCTWAATPHVALNMRNQHVIGATAIVRQGDASTRRKTSLWQSKAFRYTEKLTLQLAHI